MKRKLVNIFDQNNSHPTQLISIGSGKGGVGKSFITSCLALLFSKKNKRVLAVDLDFGGANLHTSLGLDPPQTTLSQFFSSVDKTLENFIIETPYPNLSLLAGAIGSAEAILMTQEDRLRFTQKFRSLNYDVVLLDLGAGTYNNSTDFFSYSDTGIIVIIPEPTSIENAYRFIKTVYYDTLKQNTTHKTIHNWIDMASGKKISKLIRSPADLFQNIKNLDLKEYETLRKTIDKIQPQIIINQTRTLNDIEIGSEIVLVCKKYFGIQCHLLGNIDYDTAVWQSIRRKKNMIHEMPNSQTSIVLEKISLSVLEHSIQHTNWESLLNVL